MRFESKLAERIHAKKGAGGSWKTYGAFVGIVFIVLTLTASSLAGSQAVVHVGTQDSMAKYLGQFDGVPNVVLIGLSGADDWVSLKVPFKGGLSDLESISFSLFIAQTGGEVQLEPYVVLRFAEGKSLVCKPEDSYATSNWSQPYMNWQWRDVVGYGKWSAAPEATQSLAPLDTWSGIIGDRQILSIFVFVGKWTITDPYQVYVGDLAVNGKLVDLANAGRVTGPSKDLPWF